MPQTARIEAVHCSDSPKPAWEGLADRQSNPDSIACGAVVRSALLYQVIKRPTLLPISQISRDLIQRRRGEFDMAAPISLRGDFDGPMLRALVLAEKAGSVTGACCLSSRSMTAARARTRLGSGAWGCRPFAIGSSASISGGRMASSTASRPGIPRNSMTSKGARSSQWSRPVRPRRSMGSCAGG